METKEQIPDLISPESPTKPDVLKAWEYYINTLGLLSTKTQRTYRKHFIAGWIAHLDRTIEVAAMEEYADQFKDPITFTGFKVEFDDFMGPALTLEQRPKGVNLDGDVLYWQLESRAKYKNIVELRKALNGCINELIAGGFTQTNSPVLKTAIEAYANK